MEQAGESQPRRRPAGPAVTQGRARLSQSVNKGCNSDEPTAGFGTSRIAQFRARNGSSAKVGNAYSAASAPNTYWSKSAGRICASPSKKKFIGMLTRLMSRRIGVTS